ncbi:MAG: tetratricopeptide repeat protein [Pirellulales bacterium]
MQRLTLLFTVCVAFVILSLRSATADIIGLQAGAKGEINVPEALLPELDETIVPKLKPLMPLFANNDYLAFKEQYTKLLQETDTLPSVEVFWAKLLVVTNRVGDAIKVLEDYVRDHQDDAEVYTTLGILAARTGRFTDAWLHFLYAQRLLDRDSFPKSRLKYVLPTFVEARAVVAEARKQWTEADQMYNKLMSLKPKDFSVKWRYGRSLILAGNLSKGHQIMTEACESDEKLPRATLAVAQLLADTTEWVKKKENSEAVEEWFKRAISEKENDDKAWTSYFKWLVLSDRSPDVKTKFDALPDEVKKARDVALIRSVAARYLNENSVAESLLTPLHQEKPDDLEVADQLALVLIESSDEAKRGRALQLAERNFRAASELEQVAATAAWVQLQLGSSDIADKILTQLAARGPLSPQTTYYVAELLRRNGKDLDSKRLLKAAVDAVGVFPQRAKARESLASKE